MVAEAAKFATCVEQVLAQAPEHFVVLGTSFGGRVALETTLAAPGRSRLLEALQLSPRDLPRLGCVPALPVRQCRTYRPQTCQPRQVLPH